MSASRTLSVTYTDCPIIASRTTTYADRTTDVMNMNGMLETLIVFYDEVWLPYPYFLDPESPILWSVIVPANMHDQYLRTTEIIHSEYEKWRREWKPLFDVGIVRQLPPPLKNVDEIPRGFADAMKHTLGTTQGHRLSISPLLSGEFALAIHALYGSKPSPEVFISNPRDTSTHRLAGFLAYSLFQYTVPKLESLRPDEILELRESLRDSKEGFVDYIFQMVDNVEERLKSGDTTELVAARKTAERVVLTKYHEFREQLAAKKTSFGAKLGSLGGKCLQIDAAPWTPKFWGAIIGTFFESFDHAANEVAEAQAAQHRAFQYLAKMESVVGNRE